MSGSNARPPAAVRVDSRRSARSGLAQIVRLDFDEIVDFDVPADDVYRIDMALTPRPRSARGAFSRHGVAGGYAMLGDIWMSVPNERMRVSSDAGTIRCLQCHLPPRMIVGRPDVAAMRGGTAESGVFDLKSARIRFLLLNLAEELTKPAFATCAVVDLLLRQIAIEIVRLSSTVTDRRRNGDGGANALRDVERRLDADGVPPTLAELAALCGLSVRQLTRRFRAARGYSIGYAITERRVASARRLLLTDESTKSIAYRLGYASPAAFGDAFRRATGQTPHGFRSGRGIRG